MQRETERHIQAETDRPTDRERRRASSWSVMKTNDTSTNRAERELMQRETERDIQTETDRQRDRQGKTDSEFMERDEDQQYLHQSRHATTSIVRQVLMSPSIYRS